MKTFITVIVVISEEDLVVDGLDKLKTFLDNKIFDYLEPAGQA